MFNGSENAPGDYFEPLREIGATDFNGTTWFDRTNYFQTVPHAGARARPVPRERPHGPSARRGHPGEARPTRAASSRTRSARATTSPIGLVEYAQLEALFPEGPSLSPLDHRLDGRSRRGQPRRREELVPRQLRPEQRRAGAGRRHRRGRGAAAGREVFRRHPARAGQHVPPRPPVPTLPAPKVEVMKDRVANTRLYRNWVGARPARRRTPSRSTSPPACSAASPARASTTSWCARTRRRCASRAGDPALPPGQPVRGPGRREAGRRSRTRSRRRLDADRRRSDRQRPDRGRGPARAS